LTRGGGAAAIALAILAPVWLAAQARDPHEVQPERPTVATHAGTVAPGWVELEFGIERDRLGDGTTVALPTNLKIGLRRALQLNVITTWAHTSDPAADHSALGDLTIGAKWRLADDAPIIGDFALLPTVKLPTGSRVAATGTGTTDEGLLAISSHQLGPVALDVNVGYTRRGGNGRDAPRDATLWTLSTGTTITPLLGWAAEVYGYPATSGPAGSRPIVAFLTGPTASLHRWLAVDAGIIVPISGPQPHALYAGLVWNVGKI
jgi:hypothetical protein